MKLYWLPILLVSGPTAIEVKETTFNDYGGFWVSLLKHDLPINWIALGLFLETFKHMLYFKVFWFIY